jgi:phenylacetate-coenzyme A ligase PaaK-like adenylate-forming protein
MDPVIERQLFEQSYDRILRVLRSAAHTTYYRHLFSSNGIDVDCVHSYSDFRQIPITRKADYRAHSTEFIADSIYSLGFESRKYQDLRRDDVSACSAYLRSFNMRWRISSGSTGVPLEIFADLSDDRNAYLNLNLYRQSMCRDFLRHPYVWVWPVNRLYRERYGETTGDYVPHNHGYQYFIWEFSDQVFESLLEFLCARGIKWIVGAPSVLVHLCDFITGQGCRKIPDIAYIECQSEYLSDWQMSAISDVFHVQPTSVYSSNEILFMAANCGHGRMHVLPRNAFIELIENSDGSKSVVVTSLYSKAMPLIRYELGDCADWSGQPCDCDMKSPVIDITQFRQYDSLIKPDGTCLDFWAVPESIVLLHDKFPFAIEQYKVIQHTYHKLEYQIRTNQTADISTIERAELFLSDYYGQLMGYPINVKISPIRNLIPNEAGNGKYKYFSSLVGT